MSSESIKKFDTFIKLRELERNHGLKFKELDGTHIMPAGKAMVYTNGKIAIIKDYRGRERIIIPRQPNEDC